MIAIWFTQSNIYFLKWQYNQLAESFSLKVSNRFMTFNLTLLRHEATTEVIIVMRTADSELIS